MSPFIRIPLGFFIMFIGFLMVKHSNTFLEWFGSIPFAEDKFGAGGSKFFYKLLGTFTVFLGIAVSTDVISGILEDLAGLITHTSKPY